MSKAGPKKEQGKKIRSILISQPRPDNEKSPYFELAKKFGIQLDFYPFIRVEGLSGKDFRKQRVDIQNFTAIVFTSRHAIDHFFRISEELKIKISQDFKYFCITEAVALYLQKFILYRKRKVFYGADGSVKSLIDVISKHKDEKYLVPCSSVGNDDIAKWLKSNKCDFAQVSLYKTVCNDVKEVLNKTAYDVIVFFSPIGVRSLFESFPSFDQDGTSIGAFGPSTSKAVEDAGLRLDIKAPAPNAPSMVSALELFLASQAEAKK